MKVAWLSLQGGSVWGALSAVSVLVLQPSAPCPEHASLVTSLVRGRAVNIHSAQGVTVFILSWRTEG